MKTTTCIEQITQASRHWAAFVEHLDRTGVKRWILDTNDDPKPNMLVFATLEGMDVVGHVALLEEPIECIGASKDTKEPFAIMDPDRVPLRELFVQTFVVEEPHRRQGYGQMLQLEALKAARERGCYQLRSWSTFEMHANYALKVKLGFCIQPGFTETPAGQRVTGVYFIKKV